MAEQPVNEVAKPAGRGAHWQGLIEEWIGSGLTQHAFCSGRGINHQTFSWWKRRLRGPAEGAAKRPARSRPAPPAEAAFVELPRPIGAASPAYEIQLTNGRIVRLGPAIDPAGLTQLLVVLERPC